MKHLVFYTHKLQQVVSLAGQGFDFKRGLQENKDIAEPWAAAPDRQDSFRRDPGIPPRYAVDLYSTCMVAGGILPGRKNRW
ncbi:MAG: hypothetical protein C4567_14075 [Deltaproteobacteria bacterium]|nr:MAG: hypothetical protein C4567_14075 [Deltaproteobacteria bacterium]